MPRLNKHHQVLLEDGFTLVELLVVIAIIGILAAVGIPMYQGYVANVKAKNAQNEKLRFRIKHLPERPEWCSNVNQFSEPLILMTKANCNVQLITDFSDACNYVTKYQFKTETSSQFFQYLIDYIAKLDTLTPRQFLFSLGNKFFIKHKDWSSG